MIGGVLGVVVALAIGLVIALAVPGPTSSRGCIHVTYAGPVGAAEIQGCGSTARAICASAAAPGAFPSQAAVQAVVGECRKAGLPTGR